VTRFWVTVVAMSGGSVVLSADLAALKPWEERSLAIATPPIGRAARPLDMFSAVPDPKLLHLALERVGESWHMLAVLNWSDHAVRETVDLLALSLSSAMHVWDVWRESYRSVRGALGLFIAPHDVALLRLTPMADHPQVVGSDIHWAQGWVECETPTWDASCGTLTLVCPQSAPRPGTVWVWFPSAWCPVDAVEIDGEVLCVALVPGTVTVLNFVPNATGGIDDRSVIAIR
jgi:hypothetical protein